MIWLKGKFRTEEFLAVPRERLWRRVAGPESLEALFPGIEAITPCDEGWTWILRKQGAMGVNVQPRATIQMVFVEPERIDIVSVPDRPGDNAMIEGAFHLMEEGTGTRVRTDLRLGLRLPIPWFAAPLARRIAQKKIEQYAKAFSENVRVASSNSDTPEGQDDR